MAYINLIYCSICTVLFTILGRPRQEGMRGRRRRNHEVVEAGPITERKKTDSRVIKTKMGAETKER